MGLKRLPHARWALPRLLRLPLALLDDLNGAFAFVQACARLGELRRLRVSGIIVI